MTRLPSQEPPAPGTARKLEIAMAALRQIDQDGEDYSARAAAETALADIADVDIAAKGAIAAQKPQASRPDAGTIKHIPTGATWVTWDHHKQPPWELIAEAVRRLTGGAVKVRVGSDEEEPDRLYVAVYRDLPEPEDI